MMKARKHLIPSNPFGVRPNLKVCFQSYFLMISAMLINTLILAQSPTLLKPESQASIRQLSLRELHICSKGWLQSKVCNASFFHQFPETFQAFRDSFSLYGPYYADYDQLVPHFFHIDQQIGDTLFAEKLLGICQGGRADADDVGVLQWHARSYFSNRASLFEMRLASSAASVRDSFLFFLLDEIHPRSAELPEWFRSALDADFKLLEPAIAIQKQIFEVNPLH